MKRTFYHIIEDCGYGRIGSQGYYLTQEQAEKEAQRLQGYFTQHFFYIYPSTSAREPEFITL